MLVGIVAIHAATIMILLFEWLSPSGFNMKVNPSDAAQKLLVLLLISLLISYPRFPFHKERKKKKRHEKLPVAPMIINLNEARHNTFSRIEGKRDRSTLFPFDLSSTENASSSSSYSSSFFIFFYSLFDEISETLDFVRRCLRRSGRFFFGEFPMGRN